MLSKKSTVQFNGTKEQEKELLEMIHELKEERRSDADYAREPRISTDIFLMKSRRSFLMRRGYR